MYVYSIHVHDVSIHLFKESVSKAEESPPTSQEPEPPSAPLSEVEPIEPVPDKVDTTNIKEKVPSYVRRSSIFCHFHN